MKTTMRLSLLALALTTQIAHAGAIHDTGLFSDSTLARNDDGSTGSVALGFDANFFGTTYTNLFVNNNGNVTFDSTLSTYTPFSLLSTAHPMLAPFFADVDTRNAASGVTQYGQDTLGGHKVFGVNWLNVGYYSQKADKLNSFQLIIYDRSDITAGDFDFEFNYDDINWETGSAMSSGGTNGLGGNSARAGWSNGSTDSYEIAGSAVNGAFLDGGIYADLNGGLINNSIKSDVKGRYFFEVRNGCTGANCGGTVPEPATLALLGLGLLGLTVMRRKSV